MKKSFTLLIVTLTVSLSFAQVPTNGLISSWTFNNGNANDETGSHDGTIYGATLTSDRFGNPNKAYLFDAVDDYIVFGPDIIPIKSGVDDWTVSFWFMINFIGPGSKTIISQKPSAYPGFNYYINLNQTNNNLSTGYNLRNWSGFAQSNDNVNGEVGFWKNYAISYEFDGVDSAAVSFYIDGVFHSTVKMLAGSYSDPDTLLIGKDLYQTDSNYGGPIDDIYLYNRALSENEVSALYNDTDPIFATLEEATMNKMILYPNPGSEVINILVSQTTSAIITSLNGVILSSHELNGETTIDISTYAPGVYFIRTAEGQTVKFIKE